MEKIITNMEKIMYINKKIFVVEILAIILLLLSTNYASASVFNPTDSMNTVRGNYQAFTLTKLCDGRTLATGGVDDNGNVLSSAEIYDPNTEKWSYTGSMNAVRNGHVATLLADCKVLIATGYGSTGNPLISAEIYDPNTGTWSLTGSMSLGRYYATAVRMNNDNVLVTAGGTHPELNTIGTAWTEIYDPNTGTWSNTGSLNIARMNQEGLLLSDGKVLVAGGMPQGVTFDNFASAEIYDPNTGIWSLTGSMAIGRRAFFPLTRLVDGKVLVSGGGISWTSKTTDKVEIFDPSAGVWIPKTPLPQTRHGHSQTLLPDGSVLVAGGTEHPNDFGHGMLINTALIYDPNIDTWISTVDNMAEPRSQHRNVRLDDGRVLIVGGYSQNGADTQPYPIKTAELYGYTFNGFLQPVDNLPTVNIAKAGSGIPVKFSLNGNQGMDIFAPNYPISQKTDCIGGTDTIEETVSTGSSGLQYDPITDQYIYVWKTDKSWSKTCRQLIIKLNDNTIHRANFKFN